MHLLSFIPLLHINTFTPFLPAINTAPFACLLQDFASWKVRLLQDSLIHLLSLLKIVHAFCHFSRSSDSYFIFCTWLWLFSELLGWGRGTLTMETMAGCLPNSSPSFLANRTLIWVLELGSNMLREAAPVPEGLNPFWRSCFPSASDLILVNVTQCDLLASLPTSAHLTMWINEAFLLKSLCLTTYSQNRPLWYTNSKTLNFYFNPFEKISNLLCHRFIP